MKKLSILITLGLTLSPVLPLRANNILDFCTKNVRTYAEEELNSQQSSSSNSQSQGGGGNIILKGVPLGINANQNSGKNRSYGSSRARKIHEIHNEYNCDQVLKTYGRITVARVRASRDLAIAALNNETRRYGIAASIIKNDRAWQGRERIVDRVATASERNVDRRWTGEENIAIITGEVTKHVSTDNKEVSMAQTAAGVLGAIINAASGPDEKIVEREVVVIREPASQQREYRQGNVVNPEPFQVHHPQPQQQQVAVAPTQPLFYALQNGGVIPPHVEAILRGIAVRYGLQVTPCVSSVRLVHIKVNGRYGFCAFPTHQVPAGGYVENVNGL